MNEMWPSSGRGDRRGMVSEAPAAAFFAVVTTLAARFAEVQYQWDRMAHRYRTGLLMDCVRRRFGISRAPASEMPGHI